MKIRTIGLLVATSLLVMAVFATAAFAAGNSPAQLQRAGWTCMNVPGLGVHCFPPGYMASSATMTVKVYDTADVNASDAHFLGTEILVRADLYSGQPCPQEHHEEYQGLDLLPPPTGDGIVDYYACHHFSMDH